MPVLTQAGRDLVKALAAIRRAPMVAVVVIASIGVGIGVNDSLLVDSGACSRRFPADRGADFYLIEARGETGAYPGLSWPEYLDLTQRLTSFRDVLAFRMAPLSVGAADW
jgi:hypothetical protein